MQYCNLKIKGHIYIHFFFPKQKKGRYLPATFKFCTPYTLSLSSTTPPCSRAFIAQVPIWKIGWSEEHVNEMVQINCLHTECQQVWTETVIKVSASLKFLSFLKSIRTCASMEFVNSIIIFFGINYLRRRYFHGRVNQMCSC